VLKKSPHVPQYGLSLSDGSDSVPVDAPARRTHRSLANPSVARGVPFI